MKKYALATLIISAFSFIEVKAQNAPLYLWGPGLDGSTYQKTGIYSDTQYGLLFEAPLSSTGARLPVTFNWRGTETNPPLKISSIGNVGIGTTTPTEKLSVNGNIQISNAAIPMGLITELGGTVSPLLNMSVNFRESNKNNTHRGGAIRIDTRDGLPLFQWLSRAAGSSIENEIMALTEDGKLGIGTMSPAEKLSVNGKIRAKEIKVESANWPDYVFEDDYKPTTLQETEQFIKTHKHLPEMPSEAEVKAEGISLGEMNAKLLKKIEELTLHLIEQNKRLEVQSEQIGNLQTTNLQLQEEMRQLKTKW